jgi:hypothetical protein
MNSQAIIVLGMHRSGTSASTGMLRCLGVMLGTQLYSGHAEINAKGYFEHSDITDTDEEALLALNSGWDDILPKPDNWWKEKKLEHYAQKIKYYLRKDFSNSLVWAIKDPRICRMLPWWLDILSDEGINAKFLIIIRPPHEVYLSLNRRDKFSLEKSYLLWILHYLDAEYWTRALPRTFVTFDSMVNDPIKAFVTIEKSLDLAFPTPLNQASACLSQFISKDLIHHRDQQFENDKNCQLVELGLEVYELLLAATTNSQFQPDFVRLDKIRLAVNEIQNSFSPLLVESLRDVYLIRSELQLTMNKIFRSKSWTLGKPVRFFERLLGRDI